MKKDKVLTEALASIETTIGELIETVTAIAMESGRSERECYELATVVVNDLLSQSKSKPSSESLH